MDNPKTKFMDPTRILTLANMISLLRAFMAIPIIIYLQNENWTIAFVLIILAILSDTLDGYFARRAHEVTHFGKWLDPIADFVVILAVTSYLVMEGIFPAWFYWFYLGRYVAIALSAIYYLNSTNFVLQSNWYGKWSAGITTFSIILHIFPIAQLSWLPQFTLYIATGLLTFSYLKYVRTFYQASKQS